MSSLHVCWAFSLVLDNMENKLATIHDIANKAFDFVIIGTLVPNQL